MYNSQFTRFTPELVGMLSSPKFFTDPLGSKGAILNKKTQVVPNSLFHEVRMNIILADDDIDDRELFSEALEESGTGVKLETAEDGEALLKLLNGRCTLPDIIFLDLNMPNKNGIECLKEIRNTPKFNDIPIIIYSTSTSKRDIDDTYDQGANLYVSKPSSYNNLKKMISKILLIDWNINKPKTSKKKFLFSFEKE